jgi:pimeloyl-ACP methyl ester carboxylesterase
VFDPGDLEVYGGLEDFLDGLVASSTIKEWRAYPYDWRYDPEDVVREGALTEEPDGSLQRVYLADVLREMASSSPTGKVTIVAHSNGGLVAKALAVELGPSAADYIDRIIMVGTPQFGTPSAVGALLHGDGQELGPHGIVATAASVRTEAAILPGAYALLPSPAYFSQVATPVVAFSSDALLAPFVTAYGNAINSFGPFESFIDDGKEVDEQFDNNGLKAPLALPTALIGKAEQTHQDLDSWQPPPGISVSAIAGWGQLTDVTLSYTKAARNLLSCSRTNPLSLASCALKPILQHTEIRKVDGDGTVVSPSAIGDVSDAWYFDTKTFKHDSHTTISHQNLTSAAPIQGVVSDLLQGLSVDEEYIVNAKPPSSEDLQTIVSSHSPVNLIAVDAEGNKTGVVPVPGTDLSLQISDIPESAVDVEGEEEYLDLPQEGAYTITAAGNAVGLTTLEVENLDETGEISSDETFPDIPTTASTTMTLTLAAGSADDPQVDEDGDGASDFEVASGTPPELAPQEALAQLRELFAGLRVRPGVKNRLLKQLELVEDDAADPSAESIDIDWLETLIKAQTGVKLGEEQGALMLGLVDYLRQ